MPPELLYEIYKYLSPTNYLKLNKIQNNTLGVLVDTFKDPLEGRYMYNEGKPIDGLKYGLRYIALTNPTWTYFSIDSWGGYRWDGRYDETILDYALQTFNLSIVQLLLLDPRVGLSERKKVFGWAAILGFLEIVDLLLQDPRIDPSDKDNSAIRNAAHNGHTKIVHLLLQDSRVNPTTASNSAIIFAAGHGHLDTVRLLLSDERVDPTALDNSAIKLASDYQQHAMVRLLLKDMRVNKSLHPATKKRLLKKISKVYKRMLVRGKCHILGIGFQEIVIKVEEGVI